MKPTDFDIQDERIQIRPLTLKDLPQYHRIRLQHSMIYRITCDDTQDGGLKFFREDVFCEENFFCGIIDMKESTFVGYLGVHDMKREVWEISIELDKDYCHRGFGSLALTLFLNELYRVTGHAEYKARVDADNVASQGCFEKIGAKLVGICNGNALVTEDEKRRMEEKYSHLITEQITALAGHIGVEPRKLLSHALEYRLNCPI